MTAATISYQYKRAVWHPETEEARKFEKRILALIEKNSYDEAVNLVSARSTFYFESSGFDEPCDAYFSMDKTIVIPFTYDSARVRVGSNQGMLNVTFDVDFELAVKQDITEEEFKQGLEMIGAEYGAYVDFEGFEAQQDDGGHFVVSSFCPP